MPDENQTQAAGASLTRNELDGILKNLNTFALSLRDAAKAVESIRNQLDALRDRLPPGPGSPNPANP
jgi:hypothetical protein